MVYLLLGLFVGLFAGMLGIGGGMLLVPLLVFMFSAQDFPADRVLHLALGTSLADDCFFPHYRASARTTCTVRYAGTSSAGPPLASSLAP